MSWISSIVLLFAVSIGDGLFMPPYSRVSDNDSYGERLFLTPILEKGDIKEARMLSKVRPNIGHVRSYSGFFTIDWKCQSNLFFWFFPAKNDWKQAPLVLWLQGGPGSSSLYGLFQEIGPFSFEKRITPREATWNEENNLLFIDQPVGTGFSFTNKGCYAKNETQVGDDLYSAIVQFFQLFPEIKENKFFITGESYAGHYVPAFGYKIHKSNQINDFKINLKGMMIGNGWMDEFYQRNTTEYLYQIGLMDFNQKINGGSNYEGYFDPYNYLNMKCDSLNSPYIKLLESYKIRKSIHVGKQNYKETSEVVRLFLNNRIKIKPMVEELLDHYPMVFYNGQLDTLCPYPLMIKFLRALDWSGAENYKRAPRYQWCEAGSLAGYYKSAGNLHEVLVRNAGHMVPRDQPRWALSLVNSVTSNPPDNPLASLPVCPP